MLLESLPGAQPCQARKSSGSDLVERRSNLGDHDGAGGTMRSRKVSDDISSQLGMRARGYRNVSHAIPLHEWTPAQQEL